MDKLIIAEIDSDMGNSSALEVKENQIARVQFCQLDMFPDFADGPGTVWQHHSHGLVENVTHKTAAVETCFGADAASAVRNSNLIEGQLQQALGSVRRVFYRGLIRVIRSPAAGLGRPALQPECCCSGAAGKK